MTTKKNGNNNNNGNGIFSVFGTRPEGAIYLPDLPYSVRLNCKDGGLFVGGNEAQHRKSNPDQKVDISIIKVSKFFGTLGKTENVLWIQLFFIPVDGSILPKNTVCVSYIKKQSISHLFNKVQEAMNFGDPGMGIFSLGFDKQVTEKGSYYTVTFDWRERTTEAEKQQLEAIASFMQSYGNQLIDFDGTRDLVCVDGWSAEELQSLQQGVSQEQRSLPAAI